MVSGAWKTQFDELVAYKEAHGDCYVPAKWKQNRRLANWVSVQRQMKKRDLLPEERIKRLEEVGFDWQADHNRQSWTVRYTDLMEFKEMHGHCDVPAHYSANPSLGIWVVNQRQKKKRSKLSIEQERLLDHVGFLWHAGPTKTPWRTRYAELLEFRAAHGHCNVPRLHADNPTLGFWVVNQRTSMRTGKLSPEQIRLLDDAGFIWSARSEQSRR